MKAFIISLSLLVSVAASASEVKVLEVSASDAGKGSLSTRFEVNTVNDTVGVSVKITRKIGSSRNRHVSTRTFEAKVSELSLNGKDLEFNKDGQNVVCGTMGVTRILKLPTLLLNGKCDLVAKRVNGNVVVSLIAE